MFAAVVGLVQPAAAETPAQQQLIQKGRQVFLTAGGIGCAACHGRYADGDVGIGPNNRGMNEAKVRAAFASVPSMKAIGAQLSDVEIREVAAYVEWLGQIELVKAMAKAGRFVPDRLEIYPGTKIQLVVKNASIEPHKFVSADMKIAPIVVQGRRRMDVIWQAPESEGSYALSCADCATEQPLTIAVTRNAKRFIPVEAQTSAASPPSEMEH